MYLSIVLPVHNEVKNLPILHTQLCQTLNALDFDWEAIYVDDGSTDGSADFLRQLSEGDPEHVCVVFLRRNFGQTAAIAAGIDQASGEVMVLMDADLQNDPADIPMLLDCIHQGYDLVSGWRVKRQDTFLSRRLPSLAANWLISKVTGVSLHDYGCTLKAYRREVITEFRLYGEMHRFIPVYAHMAGAKLIEVPVQHHPRKFGHTKYGINRTLKVILDLVTVKFLLSYGSKPIYLFGGIGIFLILISSIIIAYLVLSKILVNAYLIQSPLLLLSAMLFLLGAQSILMGLIAELQVRTYHESQHKPTYTIKQILRNGHSTEHPVNQPDAYYHVT
jgi:glycosyltransferase involved in cell wall biosynthesis